MILKIIITAYGVIFLNFIGIEKGIAKILRTEFTTLNGNRHYLDFLCLLDDGTLCNMEFQFPEAKPMDLDRFFEYNIITRVHYGSVTETMVINFTSQKIEELIREMGESISFHPKYFYLGDIDFDRHWQNINMKSETNVKLTGFEEIVLMIASLVYGCKNRFEILDNVSILLKNEFMFDKSRFDIIKAVIKLEIENLLSKEEQDMISEEIDMTPKAEEIIVNAIREVNDKVLYETEVKAREEGIKKGIKKGKKEGRDEGRIKALEEMARNLKDTFDDDEISQRTGLSLERVREL